jgi:hypothetical protein
MVALLHRRNTRPNIDYDTGAFMPENYRKQTLWIGS